LEAVCEGLGTLARLVEKPWAFPQPLGKRWRVFHRLPNPGGGAEVEVFGLLEVRMKKLKAPTAQMKFRAALEAIRGERSLVEIARAFGVHPNTVAKWKAELLAKGAMVFGREGEEKELLRRVRELEQLIGRKEVEIALLKNFLGQGR